MSKTVLRRQIFVGCKSLGMDDEARQDMQRNVTGIGSMKEMSASDLKLIVDHLKNLGWKPSRGQRKHKLAPRRDLRLVHVLWRELGHAGVLTKPGRAGLNAFIRSRFEGSWSSVPLDVDMLRDPTQINDVIQALRQWCVRENVELDR